MSQPHIDALRTLAERIAREAGEMVAAARKGGFSGLVTKSSATDVVTEYDKASERLVVERILERRPDDTIVGEEGADRVGSSGLSWLVDPIDGTTNFLYGLPGYAVSIAVAGADGTLAGAVYVPATDELFSAGRGSGATLNGGPIFCSATTSLGQALVATGFSYLPERRQIQAERVAGFMARIRDIRRSGAASVDLCSVAAGRVDVYFEEFLGPWDLAAGELIAREAGCRSGDFRGGSARPSEVLVCAPALFDAMAALIRGDTIQGESA